MFTWIAIIRNLTLVILSTFSAAVVAETKSDTQLKAPLTYESVKQFIEKNKIESIDQFIPYLPKEYRENYVLMFQSQSAQYASERHPRIISFGGDSSFIMAFTGDPKQPGFQRMEMIQFREKPSKFDFKEIVFDPQNKKVNFVENPQSCKNCHRTDSRPNWEPYNLWRGAYFGVDNYITKGTREWDAYNDYLKNSATKGRYQYFKELLHDGSTPKGDDYVRGSEGNRTFGEGVFDLNRQRLARKLISHPDFPALKYAIMGAALNCKNIEDFIPKDQQQEFKLERSTFLQDTVKFMRAENEERRNLSRTPPGVTRHGISTDIIELEYYDRDVETSYKKQLDVIVSLRYLLENRGMSSSDWSTSFNPKLLSFYDGTGPAIDYLAPILAKKILESDAELSKFFALSTEGYYIYRSRIKAATFKDDAKKVREACPLLKEKSLKSLRENPLRPIDVLRVRRIDKDVTGLQWREHLDDTMENVLEDKRR
jgi:hypothetical protein